MYGMWLRFVALSVALTAVTSLGASGAPRIKFGKQSHDFGKVMRGAKMVEDFIFTNTGDGPLRVQGVHAACGCTAVELDTDKLYGPGESGSIRVTFDTSDFEGKILKTITVMTNEKVTPDRLLTLTADVASEFLVQPPLVDFGDVVVGQQYSKSFKVSSVAGHVFQTKELRFNRKLLDVSQRVDGRDHVFEVTLRDNAPHGFLKETLIVANGSKNLPELRVPVRALINGRIRYSPSYIEFGAIMPKETAKRVITVSAPDEFSIKTTRAELHINGEPVPEAQSYVRIDEHRSPVTKQDLAVVLSNVGSQSGSVHGKLFIETSDPAQKELQVDFYAFFR